LELNDSELIQACIEKNKRAWDLFVERFSKLIYWSIRKTLLAFAFANREELIQEIFQEIFERLIEKEELKKLQSAQSIRKFLSVMSCHAALDKAKAAGRFEKRVVLGEVPESVLARSAAPRVFAEEESEMIEGILGELSPKERACVELHYFDELTFREVGNILGVSEDTVSTVVRRAKDKIKVKFNERK